MSDAAPSYYGVPYLKPPRWGWEIALYFFTEGISAGCFVYAATADLFGGPRRRGVVRTARAISSAALLPCPPLLIADLGSPERFHHMLRVLKPSSPMNLGAWTLAAYGAHACMTVAPKGLRLIPERAANLAGLPFAITMIAYPGVLLATTSTPAWMPSRALGALMGSSSMATAASALALAQAVGGKRDAGRALERLENAAHLSEAAALAAYLWSARDAAKPLVSGPQSRLFWLGAVGAGLVLPAAIRAVSKSRTASVLSALCSLAGGLALKWSFVHAGPVSARDASANHHSSRRTLEAPGWAPP